MKSEREIGTLFTEGLNCAQITLSEFCKKYGLDGGTAMRIACGFGGGMRCGEVCGAVTGGIMVIGLKAGMETADNAAAKADCYAKTLEFCRNFRERRGSIVCRELLGCDLATEEGRQKATDQGLFRTVCPGLVREAIGVLEEMKL